MVLENLYHDNSWCDKLEGVVGVLGDMGNKNKWLEFMAKVIEGHGVGGLIWINYKTII